VPLVVGDRLGHYDVNTLIGEGGMGQVYQATDTRLNRQISHPDGDLNKRGVPEFLA
jgi:serine/threonine protein kinase